MSLKRPIARLVLVAVACILASGCVSLFPKGPAAQLYRFGAEGPATPAAAPPSQLVIAHGPVDFDSAAATDRILTITGQDAAYIEASRWIAPAPVLFEEALERQFQRTPGAPRLVARGTLLRAPLAMSLDVQTFEARYDHGADGSPTVRVAMHVTVFRTDDRTVAGETLIISDKPAGDNRVGAIVQAYDLAVQDVLAQLITWTSGLKAA